MNDADEWFYALRLFDEVLQEYKGAFRSPYEIVRDTTSLHDHFTFSFSEEKDLLSQWRGYCPNGGYSFCFDDLLLNQVVQTHKLMFEPCIYDKEEQKEFIRNRIITIKPDILAKVRNDRMVYEMSQGMVSRFYSLCLLKHPSFKEEREWRMVGSL